MLCLDCNHTSCSKDKEEHPELTSTAGENTHLDSCLDLS